MTNDNGGNNNLYESRTVNKNKQLRNKRFNVVLMIIAGISLLTGVVLLLIDPIKSWNRQKVTDDAKAVIESQIKLENVEESAITYVVPRDGNEVTGEEYDYYGDEDDVLALQSQIAEEEANLPEKVTLVCDGILKIDCIDFEEPIWDSSSRVALRYGVGHYENSVKPGEEGNCTILGHRNRHTSTMFYRLAEVKKDDLVNIKSVDGNNYEYVVTDVKIVSPSKLLNQIVAEASTDRRLTLITCATEYGEGYRRLVICHMQGED